MIEGQCRALWSAELQVPQDHITSETDFFALGGNSLQAFTLLDRAEDEHSIVVTIDQFFADPTFGGFCAAAAKAQS